jgi:hypothetical protein
MLKKEKNIPKIPILDLLHRGVVWACIGATVGGTVFLGYRFYRYFTVVKPERERLELQGLQQGFPVDPANLVDNAPKLKT